MTISEYIIFLDKGEYLHAVRFPTRKNVAKLEEKSSRHMKENEDGWKREPLDLTMRIDRINRIVPIEIKVHLFDGYIVPFYLTIALYSLSKRQSHCMIWISNVWKVEWNKFKRWLRWDMHDQSCVAWPVHISYCTIVHHMHMHGFYLIFLDI